MKVLTWIIGGAWFVSLLMTLALCSWTWFFVSLAFQVLMYLPEHYTRWRKTRND